MFPSVYYWLKTVLLLPFFHLYRLRLLLICLFHCSFFLWLFEEEVTEKVNIFLITEILISIFLLCLDQSQIVWKTFPATNPVILLKTTTTKNISCLFSRKCLSTMTFCKITPCPLSYIQSLGCGFMPLAQCMSVWPIAFLCFRLWAVQAVTSIRWV